MIQAWLIYSKEDAKENHTFIQWFVEEALEQHIKLSLVLREDLQVGIFDNQPAIFIKRKKVTLPSIAIVRTIEPLLSYHLEQLGIQVFNNSNISSICNDKARTHLEINTLQIPMVTTFFFKHRNLTSHPPFPFPFVIKDTSGRGGKSVEFIQTSTEWEKYLKLSNAENVVIQVTKGVQLGKDIRVFIVGKEIVGAVLRENTTDFRANFKLGGSASWYQLSQKEKQLVEKIIHHFDFDMVGIDFLLDYKGQLLFNEIEDVVGSRTLSSVSTINIVKKYVTHIKRKLTTKKEPL